MMPYEHRQASQWMVLILAIAAVLFAIAAFVSGAYAALVAPVVLIACAILFTTLQTRVDANGVSWAFTAGFPGGHLAFDEIADVAITTTNAWLEGYGLHWTIWHGWLWNVSGYGAVMLTKRDGKRVTLGTDDPQGLYDAIVSARAQRSKE